MVGIHAVPRSTFPPHEWDQLAEPTPVGEAGHDFLACAGLSQQQHIRFNSRKLGEQAKARARFPQDRHRQFNSLVENVGRERLGTRLVVRHKDLQFAAKNRNSLPIIGFLRSLCRLRNTGRF